jgi:hypothetical protein
LKQSIPDPYAFPLTPLKDENMPRKTKDQIELILTQFMQTAEIEHNRPVPLDAMEQLLEEVLIVKMEEFIDSFFGTMSIADCVQALEMIRAKKEKRPVKGGAKVTSQAKALKDAGQSH